MIYLKLNDIRTNNNLVQFQNCDITVSHIHDFDKKIETGNYQIFKQK